MLKNKIKNKIKNNKFMYKIAKRVKNILINYRDLNFEFNKEKKMIKK